MRAVGSSTGAASACRGEAVTRLRIGIVGAGISGLACAEKLARQGHRVRLFDRGRGAGGRMATRRVPTGVGTAHFDHGAQYFTVRDPAFRRRVEAWIADGVVARWPSAGVEAHVGVPAMNAPLRRIADAHSIEWQSTVTRIDPCGAGWRLNFDRDEPVEVDVTVVATPAERAAQLLAPIAPDLAARAQATRSEPCWTAMLAFAEPVAVAQDCWRGEGLVAWAARNNSKLGRTGPESWVVQAGPSWSRSHEEADPVWVIVTLTKALSNRLGVDLPALAGASSHRWRYARSGGAGVGAGAIFDRERRLGLCGDWLIGPRVEAAWRSGDALAAQIGVDVG